MCLCASVVDSSIAGKTYMPTPISFYRAFAVAALAAALLLPAIGLAQEPGGQGAPPPAQGPPGGGQPGGGRPPSAGQPPTPDRNQQPPFSDSTPRQIFLSGSVRLSDGNLPPANVVIERVCNGVVRPEGYTDSKGNFSIVLGSANAAV